LAIPWKDTWEDGHFVVLVAMDGGHAYFMDPSASAGYGFIPLAELEERWHDYDLVDGKKVIADRVGIAIRGEKGLSTNPGPMVRIN
jgi:ABC-type bacteriocin/lantibiotic exporter with double-glycine peptidase domain